MPAKKHRHLIVFHDDDWDEIMDCREMVNKSASEILRRAFYFYFNSNTEGSFHRTFVARLDYETLAAHIERTAKKEHWSDEELEDTLIDLKEKKGS